jgi:tRNA1(Val) A37 N6-methylase TrmN6
VPEGTIGGAVSGARDAAVAGAMTQVYGEQPPTDTVKGIMDLEGQQEGAAAAPAAEPAAAPAETEGQAQPGRSPLHPDDLTPNEAGAHAGASSPLNDKSATREQILAGNAPLGHMTLGEGSPGGKTDVSIENAAGSVRTDLHNEPPKWSTPMANGYHYGYIRRTEGNDGDKFDVFVKEGLPENWAGTVWVVDQASRDGKFDEHKGVIGPQTEQEARDAYLSHYEKGWKGLRAVTPMPWAQFKQWVHDGKKTEPANPAAFAEGATHAADAPAEERGGRAPAAAPAVGEPAGAAGEDAGPVAPALRLGKMPNNAEAVTLAKDGTVMIGKYAAVDYDSGEPVVLKPDANESQIKHALHNAGAVPAGHKFFGGTKEAVAPAPKPQQNAAAQDSTTAAPSQGAGSQQASAATPPAASAAPSTDERTQDAPPTGGKVTPSQVWENTLPKDRERYVLEAGWKKGSPKTAELVGKAWGELMPVQKEKLSAAIGKAAEAAPSTEVHVAPGRPRVVVNRVGADGMTDQERAAKQTVQQRWNSGDDAIRREMLAEIGRPELVNTHLGIAWDALSSNLQASFRNKAGEPMPKAAPKPVTPQIPPAAPKADKAEIRPVRRSDGSVGYEAVPIAAPAPAAENASSPEARVIKPSANTVFTDDAAAAARARLRKKLGTLNQGLDPETMLDGITLAGYHIEKGARTFAAYAKAMLEDLGDAARPYLKSWYMGVKYDPRAAAFSGEMSSAAFVDEFDHTAIATPAAGPAEAPAVETEAPSADTGATDDSSPPANPPADDSHLAPVEPRPGAGGTAAVRGAIAEEGEPAGRADDGGVRQPDERAAKPDDAAQGLGDGGSDAGVPDRRTGNLAKSRERDLAGDYRAPAGALTREGSWLTTAKRNVDLIELALKIQAESRPATPEEQAQLAKYVGFGAGEIRNKLFPVPHQFARQQEPDRLIWPNMIHEASWKQIAERLDKLPREWQRSVLQSTQYAHYTSENVVRGIWSAVQRLGFTGGKILEPGTGIGNFAMVMPESMRRPKGYTGIEMDGPTALIARLLSPAQNMLHEDFIKRKLPRDFFDLAIGNPPFSQTKILGDPDYEKHGFMLHDFFFAKTIDRVRPGGLLVFVTSKGTMDKQTDRARKYLSDRADLLGAIRLPSTAFEANAGTSVVTDVIFLRKREADAAPAGPGWMGVATVETKDGPVVINEYFAAHPEMVLGQNRISGGEDDEGRRINSNGYGGEKYTVVSYDKTPEELDAKFAAAVQALPANVYSVLKASPVRAKEETRRVDYDPKVKREGVVYMDGKTLMRVESGVGRELKLSEKDAQWMGSYVGLRDLVHVARQTQAQDGEWEPALKALNKAYDAFVKKHGPINDFRTLTRTTTDEDGNPVETTIRVFKNKRLLREDYDHALMISLEQIDEAGKIKKSPFLAGRTIGKPQPREVKTIGDALAVSLDETGHLDLEDVGRRLHITPEEAIEALGTNVYKAPSGQWQLADEYLSGDVVAKLEEAQTAAEVDRSLERNIEALKAVQPDRLGPSQISVKLGASWVPAEHVSEFAKEIGAGAVTFDSKTETWQVQGGNERSARRAGAEYGTAARSPSELLEAALNSRQVVIKTKDADKKEVTDTEATTAANEMLRKIKEKFKSWVWTDTDRASTLVDTYNRRFNNIAPRRFDGSHLTLPGVSLRFKLHPHQLRAIWRQIQTGNTYLAHAVGAGKTIEMIAGGMEQRRLGLISKPTYVVPNHMLEQFSNEFMELYPLANIMVADDENFSAERRKAFVAAAT